MPRGQQLKTRAKGVLHIVSINFGQKVSHGGGMYVGDAITWLQQFQASALHLLGRLDVAPVLAPGSSDVPGDETANDNDLQYFGFGADGPMSNGI